MNGRSPRLLLTWVIPVLKHGRTWVHWKIFLEPSHVQRSEDSLIVMNDYPVARLFMTETGHISVPDYLNTIYFP